MSGRGYTTYRVLISGVLLAGFMGISYRVSCWRRWIELRLVGAAPAPPLGGGGVGRLGRIHWPNRRKSMHGHGLVVGAVLEGRPSKGLGGFKPHALGSGDGGPVELLFRLQQPGGGEHLDWYCTWLLLGLRSCSSRMGLSLHSGSLRSPRHHPPEPSLHLLDWNSTMDELRGPGTRS
jgi:hypothetical protein